MLLKGALVMKWYGNLYIGERVNRYAPRIRQRLDAGKSDIGHYIITLAAHPSDYLDLFDTRYLTQNALKKRLPMIVGLAADRDEALIVAQKIVEDCISKTGSWDVRTFLQS